MGLILIVVLLAVIWFVFVQARDNGRGFWNAGTGHCGGHGSHAGHATHTDTDVSGADSPEEILKRRYARGEIDKTEFDERRKDILGA